MNGDHLHILALDDERDYRLPLIKFLENNFGYQIDGAESQEEAFDLLEKGQGCYDVALIDENLPSNANGIQILQEIKSRYREIECIILTGWGKEHQLDALKAGAFRHIEKSIDKFELGMIIRAAGLQARIQSISKDIISLRDQDQALARIADAARSLSLADDVEIILRDLVSDKLHTNIARDSSSGTRWHRHFTDKCLTWEIIKSGNAISIPDISSDQRSDIEFAASGFLSFVGVPIPGESGNLGVLYVYSNEASHFDTWGTVALLQTLAGLAGLAIANAQAFNQIRSHANYMEALVRTSQGLTRNLKQEEQLALAWDFVREQLKVSTFLIGLFDPSTDTLRYPLVFEQEERIEIKDLRLGSNQSNWGISGYIVKKGIEFLWNDLEEKSQKCSSLGIESKIIRNPCQSGFFLPIKTGDVISGFISIQSYDQKAFSPIQLNAFRALGNQLAIALESSKLFQTESKRLEEAETLRGAVLTLTTNMEQDKIFKSILTEMRKVVPYDCATIQLLNGAYFEIIEGFGLPESIQLKGITFPVGGNNPNARVYQDRKPIIVADAPVVFPGFLTEPHVQANIHSYLGVPMLAGEELIGMLALGGHEINFYTPQHAGLAQTFATQAAYVVLNAQLLRSAREGRTYIELLFKASEAIISPIDPDQVLQAIVNTAIYTAGAWRAAILQLHDRGASRVLTQVGFEQNLDLAATIRPTGISIQVFGTQHPKFFNQIDADNSEVHPSMIAQGVRAAACLPLCVENRAIGVLWIHFKEPHTFSETEQQALQIYASQSAIAYDHAKRIRELKHMRKSTEALAGATDVQAVLEQIVRGAGQVLQSDSTAIWSYDDVLDSFIPEKSASFGIDFEIWREFLGERPGVGKTAYTVMEKEWVGVENIYDQEKYGFLGEKTRNLLTKIRVQSFQGIALKTGDEKLGVLYINYNDSRNFSQEEKETARTFANHAALALKKARLLEQVSKARNTARVVAKLSTFEDLQSTLKEIADGSRDVLGCDAVTLYAYDQERGEFEFPPAMAGVRDETAVKLIGHVARASVVWNILALDKPYQTDNAQVDQRMKGPFVMREGIVSSVGVPLREGALKVGVAFFNYRKYHRFTDEEMVNIELFSDQAAVAIRIVQLFRKEQRLHEELQKKFEELTRTNKLVASRSALAWMGMASSTWRHAIEKHALTIKDQVKLLRMQIQRGEIQTEKIEVRLTSIEKMASFIMEKPITPPLSNEEGVGPVEINQLVKERMMALWKNEPYSLVELNFDLKLDDQARVRASSEWLRRALDILVDNAVEATAGQERRKMTVSTNPNGDRIEIAVRDSGLGIPDHIREYFLVSPVPKGEGEKGLGLGLLLAQTIVQTYGGEIQLGPSDSSGTTMIIALPLLV